MKSFFILVFMLVSFGGIQAQIELHSFTDIGENNASDGVYVKSMLRGDYGFEEYDFSGGVQFDIVSANPNVVSGLDLAASRSFEIREFPFRVQGIFMMNRFSDLLYETNWGFRVRTRKYEHFLLELGTNFKTYGINSEGRKTYDIARSDSRLSENFNLTYVVSAYLKPHEHEWNAGVTVTNVDYYTIYQPSNPVFNVQLLYRLRPDLTLHLDGWYKQAGMMNIYANYFGYFFRGGVTWAIK